MNARQKYTKPTYWRVYREEFQFWKWQNWNVLQPVNVEHNAYDSCCYSTLPLFVRRKKVINDYSVYCYVVFPNINGNDILWIHYAYRYFSSKRTKKWYDAKKGDRRPMYDFGETTLVQHNEKSRINTLVTDNENAITDKTYSGVLLVLFSTRQGTAHWQWTMKLNWKF